MFDELSSKVEKIEQAIGELKQTGIFDSAISDTLTKFIHACENSQNKKRIDQEDVDIDAYSLIIIHTQLTIGNGPVRSMELSKIVTKNSKNFTEKMILKAVSLALILNELQADNNGLVQLTEWKKKKQIYEGQISNVTIPEENVKNLYAAYILIKEKNWKRIEKLQIKSGMQYSGEQAIESVIHQIAVIWNDLKIQEHNSKRNEEKALSIERKIYGSILEIGAILIAIVGFISFNLSAVLSDKIEIAQVVLINMVLIAAIGTLLMFITIIMHPGKGMLGKLGGIFSVLVIIIALLIGIYANIDVLVSFMSLEGKG